MKLRADVCLVGLCFGCGAWGQQQPGLVKRPEVVRAEAAPPPAAMTVPEKLEQARPANANATYQALRGRTPNGASYRVKELVLKRDAAVFTLHSGTLTMMSEVQGVVTGAVFAGDATLHVEPPSAMEKRQLKAVMKTEVLDQRFSSAVFAFTDGTGAEVGRAAGVSAGMADGSVVGVMKDAQTQMRWELKYNVEARLLEDVLRPEKSGGYFLAVMKGAMFSKRMIYMVDPHGAIGVAPEEVALLTSGFGDYDGTLGFRSEAQRAAEKIVGNETLKVPEQTIDVTIERNGHLAGTAVTAVTAREAGVRVLPLELFPTLRVSGVWGPEGEALDFIQQEKDLDSGFAVVLKKPLAKGETIAITTSYAGKDAVTDEGNGNYFLVARESWYPNMRGAWGNYAFYNMTFHTPKNVQVVATGNRVSDGDDGKLRKAVWKSMAPMPVAGFNLGEFKLDQSERSSDVQVVSYANVNLAEGYGGLTEMRGMALGNLNTTGMLKVATSEGDAAIRIYTDYFGALPYDHVSLTEQTACSYGQSWPTLVYLPICYFWDDTIKNQLGLLQGDPTFWSVVTAHEVAHQWWGQEVGFSSYRDQWMSEGFANFSAALFLMKTRKNMKEYDDFWNMLRKRMFEKTAEGKRPVDVGPVVMGVRANTSKTGEAYTKLIYPKGAWILHMLHMMYWTPEGGETAFKKAMHDFTSSYRNQPATTEDFKAVMERNMPPVMDIEHNHRLDWFFNAYVYGTEIPKYEITSEFTADSVHFKVTQSGVSDDFTMLVPVYMELADKRVILFGRCTLKGDSSFERTVKLGKMPVAGTKLVLNHNMDLLTE